MELKLYLSKDEILPLGCHALTIRDVIPTKYHVGIIDDLQNLISDHGILCFQRLLAHNS